MEIKEDYVSMESAMRLRKLGFDAPTEMCYLIGNKDELISKFGYANHNERNGCASAPTLNVALKWLELKYRFAMKIDLANLEDFEKGVAYFKWGYVIYDIVEKKNGESLVGTGTAIDLDSRGEAMQACVDRILDIIDEREAQQS